MKHKFNPFVTFNLPGIFLVGMLMLIGTSGLKAQFWYIGGNSIDWNDPLNWSTTGPTGAAQTGVAPFDLIPSQTDMVYLSDNITGPVTMRINMPSVDCSGIDFSTYAGTGVVTVTSLQSNYRLNTFNGGVNLTSGLVSWQFGGNLYFKGNSPVDFFPSTHQFVNGIHFDGATGTQYTVKDKLLSDYLVFHRFGHLIFEEGATIGGYYSNDASSLTAGHQLSLLNNTNSNYFTVTNSVTSGNQWSWPWWTTEGLLLNMGSNQRLILEGNQAYIRAVRLNFNEVEFTHASTGFRGEAVVFGQNGSLRNTFRRLQFYSNGTLHNDNRFNIIQFLRGGIYKFGAGTFQEVAYLGGPSPVQQFGGGTPNCLFTTFESTQKCSPATFTNFGGAGLSEMIVRNIHTPGWTGGNSVDLGGNTGWTWGAAVTTSASFMWKGGSSGNAWSDPANWTTLGGGAVTCIPSPIDDVFFMDGPGITPVVVVDQVGTYCRHMDWTGATSPWIFSSSSQSNRLVVRGNMTLSPNMNNQFDGVLIFEAFPIPVAPYSPIPTNTITSNTIDWTNDVYFSGCDGSWILGDDFATTGLTGPGGQISSGSGGILYLENGTLDLDENGLSVLSFNSINNNPRKLDMSFCDIELNGSENPNLNFYAWQVDQVVNTPTTSATQLELNSTDSEINVNFNASVNEPDAQAYELERVNFYNIGRLHGNTTFNGLVRFYSEGTIGFPLNPALNTALNIFKGNLRLAPGKAYVVEIGEEQLFSTGSVIITNGDCSGYTQIRSSQTGVTTKLTNNSGGTMTLDYMVLKDLEADGPYGPNFKCNNSFKTNCIPSGDWVIPPFTVPTQLWWIGGITGDKSWSDWNNWSEKDPTTNPPVNVSQCVPGPATDAVFVDASFGGANLICEVDICNAYVHNMRWELTSGGPSPTFTDNNGVAYLWVYGYWDMCDVTTCTGSQITNSYDARISFETDGDILDHIYMDPPLVFNSDMYFRGVGKTWTQRSDLINLKEEFLVAGTHYTDEFDLEVDRFLGYDGGHLDLSNANLPTVTINGTRSTVPLRYSFESRDAFQLTRGQSDIILTSSALPSIMTENPLSFYNVTFNNPATYGELWSENTFSDLVFIGSGEVYEDNTIESLLKFSPGQTYNFQDNRTQTLGLGSELSAIGNSNQYITIQSMTPNSESKLLKLDGHICVNYCNLQDFHNISNPSLWCYADNSNNWLNNYGWSFNSPVSMTDCFPNTITICHDEAYIFTLPGAGTYVSPTYLWDFGDLSPTSTAASPSHAYIQGAWAARCDITENLTNGTRYNREYYYFSVHACCTLNNSMWPVQGGLNAVGSFPEGGNDIAISPSELIVVGGEAEFGAVWTGYVPTFTGQPGFVVGYWSCGEVAWLTPAPNEAIPHKLKMDKNGDYTYVIANSSVGVEVFCVDNVTGAIVWTETFAGQDIDAGSIDVHDNFVVVTGNYGAPFSINGGPLVMGNGPSGFVAVRETKSFEVELRMWPSTTGNTASARGVSVDELGNIYAVGHVQGSVMFIPKAPGIPVFATVPTTSHGYVVGLNHPTTTVLPHVLSANTTHYEEAQVDEVNQRIYAINSDLGVTPTLEAYEIPAQTYEWHTTANNVQFRDLEYTSEYDHEGIYISGATLSGGAPDDMMMMKFDEDNGNLHFGPLSTSSTWGTGHIANGIDINFYGNLVYVTGEFNGGIDFGNGTTVRNTTSTLDKDIITGRAHDMNQNAHYYKMTGLEPDQASESAIHLMPNPTDGQLFVELQLPKEQVVNVRVVDFFGRVISDEKHQLSREDRVVLELKGQASGIYYVSVFTEDGQYHEKVVLTD